MTIGAPRDRSGAEPGLVEAGVREFGADDVPVGPIAISCGRLATLSLDDARAVLDAALECGFNVFDTASSPRAASVQPGRAEELLGATLAATPDLRDDVVIVTGAGRREDVPYDSSAEHLRASCERSLERLGVDVLDVVVVERFDWFADPAAVADELDHLVTDGLAIDVGVAGYTPRQYEALASWIEAPVSLLQFECSAAQLEPHVDGTLDLATRELVTTMARRPLAGGALVTCADHPALGAVLDRIAAREGTDRAGVALAFVTCLRSQPIPILATASPARVHAARAALGIHLDRRDCYAIVEASLGTVLT